MASTRFIMEVDGSVTGKSKLWTGDFVLVLAVALLAFIGVQG